MCSHTVLGSGGEKLMRRVRVAGLGLIVAVTLGICCPFSRASATDLYLAQAGVGTVDGSSCANPLPYTYFNGSSNWGSGSTQIGPGTTIHLCGTFSGSAGQSWLTAQGSGTAGNVITVRFESGASMQAPYHSNSGAIVLNGHDYFLIDGGTNGSIQNTLNGTPGAACIGGPCSVQAQSAFIVGLPASNIEVKNLALAGLYVHTKCEASSGCDRFPSNSAMVAIHLDGSSLLVHNNVIHDAAVVFYQGPQSASSNDDIEFYGNYLYNYGTGIIMGAGGTGHTMGSYYIHDNHFGDMDVWDTGTADSYHKEGLHMFGLGQVNSVYLYNNLFDGNEGSCCLTGWIFLEQGFGTTGSGYLWNNVIKSNLPDPNGQMIVQYGTGTKIYNNTILCAPGGDTGMALGGGANLAIENNVFDGCATYLGSPYSSWTYTTIDYNVYGFHQGGGNSWWTTSSGQSGSSLSAWKTACACDAHSVDSTSTELISSQLSSSGVPQSGFVGASAALNLLSQASGNLLSLQSDSSGGDTHVPSLRPISGAWTVGAYDIGSGNSGTAPAPPTALTALVN
jgi:hypothetical protein